VRDHAGRHTENYSTLFTLTVRGPRALGGELSSLPGSGAECLYDLFNGEPKGEGPGRQTDTNFVHINCPGIRFSCGTPSLPGGGARKPYIDVFCSH
jgi:hypothetical protein